MNTKIGDPKKMLDFFFQISSVEANTLIAAQIAATLASEGQSPITGGYVNFFFFDLFKTEKHLMPRQPRNWFHCFHCAE